MNDQKAAPKAEREFSTMIALLSAFSFGLMLAIAQAMRMGKTGISFKLSLWTAVAFLTGFNALFVYLELLFLCRNKTSRLVRRGVLVVLVLMTVAILPYQLRTLGVTKVFDGFVGSAVALCFIGTGLLLVRWFVRAAELQEQAQEAKEHQAASHGPIVPPNRP
jgi:hypothetical protein